MKKSWQEKMADKKNFPKILKLEKSFPFYNAVHKMGANAGDNVVLANTSEVLEVMNKVPKGRLITSIEICRAIAEKHKVKACCSLTTGIFIMIIANATEEMKQEGKKGVTPYWRTLKADGALNEKYPGGAESHKKLLEKEGHKIIQKGKKYFIENFRLFMK